MLVISLSARLCQQTNPKEHARAPKDTQPCQNTLLMSRQRIPEGCTHVHPPTILTMAGLCLANPTLTETDYSRGLLSSS